MDSQCFIEEYPEIEADDVLCILQDHFVRCWLHIDQDNHSSIRLTIDCVTEYGEEGDDVHELLPNEDGLYSSSTMFAILGY